MLFLARVKNTVVTLSMLTVFGMAGTAEAGIFKWIKNEAVPTITGKRPIVIKEYIKISSGTTQIKLGNDSLMIKMGTITVQTGKLRLRLAQGACVWATGDIVTCAPDFIDNQIKILADAGYKGIDPPKVEKNSGKPKQISTAGTHSENINSGLKFEDLDGKRTDGSSDPQMQPLEKSVGFDFSNPGTGNMGEQKPSLFFHNLFTRRVINDSGKLELQILGRADLAFMEGKEGGIACYFAKDKDSYILDTQNKFHDPMGYATVGSKTVPTNRIENVQIHLVVPWSELNIPNTVAPNATLFTQCFLTLDGEPMTQSDWIPL